MYKTIPEIAKETGLHRTTLNKATGRQVFEGAYRERQESRGKVIEIDTESEVFQRWFSSRKRRMNNG